MSGVAQVTRAVVAVGASILRSRGADGIASGITSADAVFVDVSIVAELVIVTILVSYIFDGSRLVKRAVRAMVLSERTTPDVCEEEGPALMLVLRAVDDCTVTGVP